MRTPPFDQPACGWLRLAHSREPPYRPPMSDSDQTFVPPSFVALFMPPGALRPRLPREVIAQRHELCEDMAQMLTETARARLLELGIGEHDVLERVHRGLACEGSAFGADEAWWVTCRLAELLGWALPPGFEGSRVPSAEPR